MKVESIYQTPVYSMEGNESLADAAERMVFHSIGALPVYRYGRLIGIVSERDLVRAIADDVVMDQTPVADYMTEGPLAVQPNTDTRVAVSLMTTHGLRHLPVVQRGRVLGMLSVRDLIDLNGG